MIVMKFGGSSVADAGRIKGVVEIVRARRARRPIVVVSALRGVTDDLITLANEALKGRGDLFDKVRQRHLELLAGLDLPANLLDAPLNELAVLTKGISLVKELTSRTLDYVMSFGERLSTLAIAATMTRAGLPAVACDAFEVGMVTDDNFGGASPLPEAEGELRKHLTKGDAIPVVTGYIGRTKSGDITTLGRNGSDFTATIVGAAVGAEEIQIWSDTDGVMTADPNVVPEARPLEVLSFEEASELAYYGGKVLHPYTIIPAMLKGIPVKVLNTFKPEHPGTTIVSKVEKPRTGVKSIAHRRNQYIVNVTTPRMLMGFGFLARIFDVFARHRIVVNMVATSEVSVSLTVDSPRRLDDAARDLREFATVAVEPDRAIICVVGEGLKTTPGVAGEVFGSMRDAGVNILMISQGASKINIAFVVASADTAKAVQALHRSFFK